MSKINFYCLGAQKAGTSTLHNLLSKHFDVFLPQLKEAPYYQDDTFYKKGIEWYYNQYFAEVKGEKVVGSVSPEFLYYPWVPERIKAKCGENIKFVIILRNPLDRAVSHYNMIKNKGLEGRGFVNAFEADVDCGNFYNLKHFSYRQRGNYVEQIQRYFTYFPESNFLFVKFEDFIKNQQATIDSICVFLNISRLELTKSVHSNKQYVVNYPYLSKMMWSFPHIYYPAKNIIPTGIRSFISKKFLKTEAKSYFKIPDQALYNALFKEYYQDDIDELEQLTGLNLQDWKVS